MLQPCPRSATLQVFEQVMVGIYVFQLSMIGLLSIKQFPYTPLLLPCFIGTMVYHSRCAGSRLPWPSQRLLQC